MLKKFFVLLSCACLSMHVSHAQKLMHGFGTTISGLIGKVRTAGGGSSSISLKQTNLAWFPRYNFVENDNSSVSVGFPVGIGIGIASNSLSGDAGISFAYELPVVLDYNIGLKSTTDNDRGFGGYFGAGFSYYRVNISHSSYSDFTGVTYGPVARAGIRMRADADSDRALTIGLFYKKGLEPDKLTTVGVHLLYDL